MTFPTETEMSFGRRFHNWLHWKLSFWQLSVHPVMEHSSKWRHFRFSVGRSPFVISSQVAMIGKLRVCLALQLILMTPTLSVYVDRSNRNLLEVPRNISLGVTTLILDDNMITSIDVGSFRNFSDLIKLTLRDNGLTHIGQGTFDHNCKLQLLFLDKNLIEKLPDSFGCSALSMSELSVWDALDPTKEHKYNFTEFTNLLELFIGGNEISGQFDASLLPRNLELMSFNVNYITSIVNLAEAMPGVKKLKAISNRLWRLSPDVANLIDLEILHLKGNDLTTLPDMLHMPRLWNIKVGLNPLICDKSLCWLRMLKWFRTSQIIVEATCGAPSALNGRPLMSVSPTMMQCGEGERVQMMTSSNGNVFRVTGPLCGEFTGPRWIPHTKTSDAELWYFLWSAPE